MNWLSKAKDVYKRQIFSLSIISGICGFCKGKQEKQKNIQNLRKKLLTFCEQGDKINKVFFNRYPSPLFYTILQLRKITAALSDNKIRN